MKRERKRVVEPRPCHLPVDRVRGIEDRDAGEPPGVVEERAHEPAVALGSQDAHDTKTCSSAMTPDP